MIARTHDAAAITTLAFIFIAAPPASISLATVLIAIFANLIGGIAPDLDQPTAPFWRNLPIGKYFGRLFGMVVGGHRFLSHSILGVALFVFLFHSLLMFIHPLMANVDTGFVTWAFAIGMVSHLVFDSFTKEGVPWLLPVPIKFGFPPLKRWRITTGKWLETTVIFPALLVLLGWVIFANYDQLVEIMRHTIIR